MEVYFISIGNFQLIGRCVYHVFNVRIVVQPIFLNPDYSLLE